MEAASSGADTAPASNPIAIALPPYTRVLVALDGTPEAAEALPSAAALAQASNAPLETLSVTRTQVAGEMRARVHQQLASKEVEAARINVDCESASGSALINEILAAERATDDATLVVAATRGRAHTGELRGSFAANVLGDSGGPLLLVGPRCRRPLVMGAGHRLVVAVDDPDLDRHLIGLVAHWAAQFGLEVELLHIEERSMVALAERSWRRAQEAIEAERQVASTIATELQQPVRFTTRKARTAIDGIVDHIYNDEVSAVVMGSHRRSAAARALLGSVAVGVVHRAQCPVLVVRPEHV